MKKLTVSVFMIIVMVGCASQLCFHDVVTGKHIIISRDAVKVYYYDGLEIIFKMNHGRSDYIVVTWDRANYQEKKKERWLVYLTETKSDYFDLVDRLGLKVDRRAKDVR